MTVNRKRFSDDVILSGGNDGAVVLWDRSTKCMRSRFRLAEGRRVQDLAIHRRHGVVAVVDHLSTPTVTLLRLR